MYFDILMLRVLADGPQHGYEIKKSVERILGGRSINNNVLYPALRRFEEQGAIEPVAAEAGGFSLADLSVAEPTLETVFIGLPGKELRD